jgi:NACHT domain-containing protein
VTTQDLLQTSMANLVTMLSASQDTIKALVVLESVKTRTHAERLHQTSLATRAADEIRDRFVKSLWFQDINARRAAIEDAHLGTFEWLFESEEPEKAASFKTWILSDGPIFWISGKPGSGKSTLMKFLVDNPQTKRLFQTALPECAIYSYFLFNPASDRLQKSLKGLLCTLTHQILEANPDLVAKLLQKYPGFSKNVSISDWEVKHLQEIFTECLKMHQYPICLIIDGLDEIDKNDDPYELVSRIRDASSWRRDLKVCVSSRPEPAFKASLGNVSLLRLQDLTGNDIRKTAEDLLDESFPSLSKKKFVNKTAILNELTRKANGVFLWLRVALRSLRRGFTVFEDEQELLQRLCVLPDDLDSLYQAMWRRLGDDQSLYRAQAAFYFRIILDWNRLYNHFPISLTSFHMLMVLDPSARDRVFAEKERAIETGALFQPLEKLNHQLEFQCAGLVELLEPTYYPHRFIDGDVSLRDLFDEKSSVRIFHLQFIHRTAQDFLLTSASGQELLGYCALSKKEITTLVNKAELCKALLCRAERHRGWYNTRRLHFHSNFGRREWRIETDQSLVEYCRIMGHVLAKESDCWKDIGLDIYHILQAEFKRRSLSTFPESLALAGNREMMRLFQDEYANILISPSSMNNYLLSCTFYKYRLTVFPSLFWPKDGLELWILNCEPDLEWSFLATVSLGNQTIPIMLNHIHGILGNIPHGNLSMRNILDRIQTSSRKTLTCYTIWSDPQNGIMIEGNIKAKSVIMKEERAEWKDKTELFKDESLESWTAILIELNTAQLIKDAIHDTLRMEPRDYHPASCHRKILAIGKLELAQESTDLVSPINMDLYEPTTSENTALLTDLVPLLNRHAFNEYSTIVDTDYETEAARKELACIPSLAHEIIAGGNAEPISDLEEHIRRNGHYIPAQADIKAYLYGETVEDRVTALETLNRKQVEFWATHARSEELEEDS